LAKPGKVFLIGAGPGDEGLLTMKAAKIIENAQVIVYDRLVDRSILARLPETAIKINVGKNAGNHPVPQDEINQILLGKALEGYDVVRLKGGDSFLFGRGGEELELLYENNIEFEVVPGVTSALAAAAYAGIPVTHRDFCSSLHIITGHKKSDGALNIDYSSLVKLNGTLIFMMSVASIGEIADGLMKNGMDRAMPCAVVENGTRSNQRKFVADISSISDIILENNVKSPALIVVGKVCSLSNQFDWFSRLPLKGVSVLVTRPKASSGRLASQLKEKGAEVVQIPSIQINRVEFSLPALENYNWLIFSSAAGVSCFFEKLYALGMDARSLCGKRIAVVGSETAKALLQYGITADFVPSVYSGEALANEMLRKGVISSADRVLIFRAKKASPGLTEILDNHKIIFDEIVVYETEYIKNDTIHPNDFDYVTFTSASCVDGFVNSVGSGDLSSFNAICIGEQTAREARKYGMNVKISRETTVDSMVKLVCEVQHEQHE
jgi:uroporphyrinogen III methyltransferase / synthase